MGTSHIPSPRCSTPPACWLPPAPQNPQVWGTEYGAPSVSRCFKVLGAEPLTWLPASVSPAQPRAAPRRGGRWGWDGDVPRWTGRHRWAQAPPASGEGRAATPLSPGSKPPVQRRSCSQSGCWPAGLLAARMTRRLRTQLGEPRFAPACLRPRGAGRDAQASSSQEQGWGHPGAGGRWRRPLFKGDVSIARRGQRVTLQPRCRLVHQPA